MDFDFALKNLRRVINISADYLIICQYPPFLLGALSILGQIKRQESQLTKTVTFKALPSRLPILFLYLQFVKEQMLWKNHSFTPLEK